MWQDILDVDEIRKTINVLKPDHQLFEIRIFGADKRKVISGYFTDADTLITALDKVDPRGKNIYFTLNNVNEVLYARTQHDRFVANVITTSDTDINCYEWFFIDFDPVRPADVSSTDEELAKSNDLKETVKTFMTSLGFSEPVEGLSGNGYHLLYRIDLPANDESKQLLNDCLSAIASLFNTKDVKIDTVNFNPARICKLYGTLAQKGANVQSRPHRMSRLTFVPERIQTNSKDLLEAIAAELPEESKQPKQTPSYIKREFDIRDWLSTYGLTYKEDIGRDCQMFLLDECPFDHSHRNGDSKIFAYNNGAIAFKCHHNSCKGKKWQDVRLLFEPDAYDDEWSDARIESGYQKHKKQKKEADMKIPLDGDEAKPAKKPKIRKLKTAEALMEKDLPDPIAYIGVDSELPLLVEGTCILSAKPKLGKSWFALGMCLALANGDDFLGYKTRQSSTLYLDLETSEVIQKRRLKRYLKGKPVPKNFYLETETDSIDNGFVEQIEAYLEQDPNIGLVVVDVFQIIRSPSKNFKETEYDHAYRDITPLNNLAQKHHISIILVSHDRKSVDPDDPFSNILGSTGLQGAATQMIVMFKRKKDDPIHVAVKGKTIDGLPGLNVKLENAEWSVVEGYDGASRDKEKALWEYRESLIRTAVVQIASDNTMWKGRCSSIIQEAIEHDIPLTDSAKIVGGFLHKHQGRFLAEDGIKITIIDKGTGSKMYKIEKSTISTISDNDELPLPDWEEASDYGASEIPFL